MKAAAANADKAIEDWKMSVLDREYLDKIQEDRVTRFIAEIAKLQKEGSLAESATDVNYHTGRKYRDWETDRKSTRLNSSHSAKSRMPSSA